MGEYAVIGKRVPEDRCKRKGDGPGEVRRRLFLARYALVQGGEGTLCPRDVYST